ncbi:MAG TPA: hypothetical protein VF765_31070 [Polyangiaceae bacterium]
MTALSKPSGGSLRVISRDSRPLAAGAKVWKGGIAVVVTSGASAGYYEQGKPGKVVAVGRWKSSVDNTGGVDGAVSAELEFLRDRRVLLLNNDTASPVLISDREQACYVLDDQTVTHASLGNGVAGIVYDVTSEGVWVEIGASVATASSSNPAFLSQAVWWIDPQNSSGHANDNNDGLTSSTPLLTDGERQRRLAGGIVANGSNLLTINFLSAPSSTDLFDLSASIYGPTMSIVVNGPAPTVVRTGTIASVTAIDRTSGVTPGGAAMTITDTSSSVTWTKGQRITIVGGPRNGAHSWVEADLGSGQATVDSFAMPYSISAGSISNVTPVAGDTYQVETGIAPLYAAELVIRTQSQGTTNKALLFTGLQLPSTNKLVITSAVAHLQPVFDGCVMASIIEGVGFCVLANCWTTGSDFSFTGQTISAFSGHFASFTALRSGGVLILDQDVYVNAGLSLEGPGAVVVIGRAGFFGTAGDALTASFGARVLTGSQAGFFLAGEGLYGHGWSGYGYRGKSGSTLCYSATPPTLTGTSGDWILGNATVAPSYFDPAARTYPAATAGTPNTWTNLVAAQPGGFGNNAHNPDNDCHILKAA